MKDGIPGDVEGLIQGGLIDTTTEGLVAKGFTKELPRATGIANFARSIKLGGAGAGIGIVTGTTMDISSGIDPTEAVVTNTAGSTAGLVAGAALTPFIGPIGGMVVGSFASSVVTKTMQAAWERS